MMVKMQHSVQRGCQGYCLSLSGGFSASRLVRWLLGFSASRLLGFSACAGLLGFSASRLVSYFAASRLLGLCRASRLLGFWSHFWAPFARALGYLHTYIYSLFAARAVGATETMHVTMHHLPAKKPKTPPGDSSCGAPGIS